eukprot:TRINITY_DN16752_c0_g3_i1.p2 TRINITY_DN16752_c0_g3~~TRINITY_DN16752_c0_g3_i1.p2  ORF type:complete len:271 (+),score=89.42 TRINITY_DN16752_c0_g3_i1:1182-1994(+)
MSECAALVAKYGTMEAALMEFVKYCKAEGMADADEIEASVASILVSTQQKEEHGGLRPMEVTVTPGAQRAFDKFMAEAKPLETEASEEADIPIGKACVRKGCSTKYVGPESLKTLCVHHPGHAVFHETYKYWSCCDRNKKYDFDEFMAITGCREGPETCAFDETSAGIPKRAPCRHDFFQVGSTVTLNIYAKKVDPSKSTFLISDTQLRVSIIFDLGKEFALNLNLSGSVDPTQCKVEIKEPKIEITLKKGGEGAVQGAAWEVIGTPIEE